MTILVFDLGNSRWKWAPAANGLDAPGRTHAYGDDFGHTLDAALASQSRPERAAAVSVVSAALTDTLANWIHRHWGIVLERLTASAQQCGVTNSYRDRSRLGADRWAALVAARHRTQGPVCIVDAGTAVTIDALDGDGVFRGGVILPGLGLQRSALQLGTAGIGPVDDEGQIALARTTAEAVATGTLLGLAGAIDRLIDEQSRLLDDSPAVLLTGGDAQSLSLYLRHAVMDIPDLVLEGVARLAEAAA